MPLRHPSCHPQGTSSGRAVGTFGGSEGFPIHQTLAYGLVEVGLAMVRDLGQVSPTTTTAEPQLPNL